MRKEKENEEGEKGRKRGRRKKGIESVTCEQYGSKRC